MPALLMRMSTVPNAFRALSDDISAALRRGHVVVIRDSFSSQGFYFRHNLIGWCRRTVAGAIPGAAKIVHNDTWHPVWPIQGHRRDRALPRHR